MTHGLTAGAAIIAITAGQEGRTVTTGGSAVCFLDEIRESLTEAVAHKRGERIVAYIDQVPD